MQSKPRAQSPKLQPFIPEMRQVIADLAGVDLDVVSVKATTTEKLGFVGVGEGISAYAVCTIVSRGI